MYHLTRLVVCLVLVNLTLTPAFGDLFRYKDGRIISGKVFGQPTQKKINNVSVTIWTVEIAPGSYVQVLESELARNGHDKLSDAEKEYEREVANLPQTAEAHCELAAWCVRHGMSALAEAHYRRALDLNPEHEVARVAAGYKKDGSGRWVKKEKIYGEQRGKVFYKGRWRFPESVAIEQAEEAANKKIAPLKKDLSRWHTSASFGRTPKQKQDAVAQIRQIRDPAAASILAEYLLETRKPAPTPVRLIYVRVLSQFENFTVAKALATASINDPDAIVRTACLDALSKFGEEVAVPMYISYLKNANNDLVNRAAEGLGQFNPRQATLPLIEALVTEHVFEVGGGAQMNVGNQGSFSMGGGPKKEKRSLQNSSVLGTLTQITNQNFDYNEPRWTAWYASVYGAPAGDLRRDP